MIRIKPTVFLSACLLLACHLASAAVVTIDEAGIDAIFGQPAFGANTIDVRFRSTVCVEGEFLEIGASNFLSVKDLVPSPAPEAAQVFFVDDVVSCAGVNASIVGCSIIGGFINNSSETVFFSAVESSFAAGQFGAELVAHEVAHQMGLGHQASGLMGETLDGDTLLTTAEVTQLLSSPLVQIDGSGQRFIEIAPVLVKPVPEPGALSLVWVCCLMLSLRRRNAVAS